MSNPIQALGAIVGGVVGFFIGGPGGAAWGFQIGMGVGSLVSPTKLPTQYGPKLDDMRQTTSELGGPVHELWGTDVVPGAVIWLQQPPIEHENTEKVGGKGAPQGKSVSYSYTQSAAIGLIKYVGPDAQILRVWENGEVVCDNRAQQEDELDEAFQARIDAAEIYLATMTIHLGDDAQLPDPTMEAVEGVGNVHGYRGLMYVVFPDRALRDDQGVRLPNFQFEIAASVVTAAQDRAKVFYTNDVWQKPPHLLSLTASVIGSGAGGAGGVVASGAPVGHAGGGGGGGAWARREFTSPEDVALISPTMQITVGLGGSAGIGGQKQALDFSTNGLATPGEDGAASAFGSLVVAGGGLHAGPFPYAASPGQWSDGGAPGTTADNEDGGGPGGSGGIAYENVDIWPSRNASDENPGAGGGGGGGAGTDLFGAPYAANGAAGNGGGGAWSSGSGLAGGNGGGHAGGNGAPGLSQEDPRFPGSGGGGGGGQTYAGGGFVSNGGFGGFPGGGGGGGGASSVQVAVIRTSGTGGRGGNGVVVLDYTAEFSDGAQVSLATVVRGLLVRDGLLADEDIDVSDLESVFFGGFVRSRIGPTRGDLDALRLIGLFDMVEVDTKLYFRRRGGAPVHTLDRDDMGATAESGAAPPLVTTREIQAPSLPVRITVRYRSRAREYDAGTQQSPYRFTTTAANEEMIEIPAHISDDLAAELADIHYRNRWAERYTHQTSVDRTFAWLRASDPILVPINDRNYRCRIVEVIDSSSTRLLDLVRDDDNSYTSEAVAETPVHSVPPVAARSLTSMLLLDVPMLREDHNDSGIWAACWPTTPDRPWQGCAVLRDNGAGPLQLAASTARATWGRVDTAAGVGIASTWDTANELVVTLARGSLASVTEAEILSGANAAAVGVHGRWEIIQWRDAEQLADYQYRLTNLLRGRRGTEWSIGSGVAGDNFVLLDTTLVALQLGVAFVGVEMSYLAVTNGLPVSSGTAQDFTGAGVALKPFSPVAITAVWVGPEATINWLRRSRVLYDVPPGGGDVPLFEETEVYDVELYVANVLVDSGTVSVPQFVSSLGTEGITEVRVYQRSAAVGRGTAGVAIV